MECRPLLRIRGVYILGLQKQLVYIYRLKSGFVPLMEITQPHKRGWLEKQWCTYPSPETGSLWDGRPRRTCPPESVGHSGTLKKAEEEQEEEKMRVSIQDVLTELRMRNVG